MLGTRLIVILAICWSFADALAPSKTLKRKRFRRSVESRIQAQDDYVDKNFDRSDWMYAQRDRLSPIRLLDLKMIGTHHSASYTINQFLDTFSVCQNTKLSHQLKAGVRYFDFRIGNYNNDIRIGHSIHSGGLAADSLKEIADFAKAHPKEFLTIAIRDSSWEDLTPKQKNQLINTVKTTFAGLAVTTDDEWFNLNTVTMKDIWAHKKNVYIMYCDQFLKNVDTGSGVVNIDQTQANAWGLNPYMLYDPWANTADTNALFQKMDSYYDSRPQPKDKFYVAQLLLTADPFHTDGVDKLTTAMQDAGRIRQWLHDHPDHTVVYLDFFLGVGDKERQEMTTLLDEVMQTKK